MATNMNPDQWQSGKSLQECLGYLFENEIACDVRFIVGEKKTEMKAHKTILKLRSPVFYAMLNGPLKETDAITVPDIKADVFKHLMRYMYTDEIKLTEETVIPVLYAAKKYCLDGLSQQCSDFLSSSMTEENVLMLYEQAHVFDDQNLEGKCMEKIKENPKKCIESPSFLELCHACCEKIITSDDLGIKEQLIYERVMIWSEAECARQELEVSDFNKRKVLGNILYKVRFPLLDKNYFAQHLLKSNLLTSDEKVEVLSCYVEVADSLTSIFNNKNRFFIQSRDFEEKAIRFTTLSTTRWEYHGIPDKIGFITSNCLYLHGVVLYGDDKMSEYNVNVEILNEKDIPIASIKTKYTASSSDYTSDILLERPVLINANTNYKVIALISGPCSKSGEKGLTSVTVNGITVRFVHLGSNNGTHTIFGQIPGLLFSYLI